MTADQIVAHYEQQWHVNASLVLNRTAGNRSSYYVTDGNGHHAGVEHHWTGEGLDFQPAECPPMCACLPGENDCNQCVNRDYFEGRA